MERGGASNIVALLEAGVPLVDSQADLTPFQRMIILKEMDRRNEEMQAKQGAGPGMPGAVNRLRQPGGGRGETVTYVNDHTADQ